MKRSVVAASRPIDGGRMGQLEKLGTAFTDGFDADHTSYATCATSPNAMMAWMAPPAVSPGLASARNSLARAMRR